VDDLGILSGQSLPEIEGDPDEPLDGLEVALDRLACLIHSVRDDLRELRRGQTRLVELYAEGAEGGDDGNRDETEHPRRTAPLDDRFEGEAREVAAGALPAFERPSD
jgi:hypothetical protein